MFRDGGFRAVLRREMEAIPLPPEGRWTPAADTGRDRGTLFMAVAAVAGMLIALALVSAQPRVPQEGSVLASPPSRPTTAPDGRRIAPLPNVARNIEYGYNLVVPAWFERSIRPIDARSSEGLLYREIYTAREGQSSVAVTATTLPPWDLVVEVWRRGDRGLDELTPSFGCAASRANTSPCTLRAVQLRYTPAQLVTITAPVHTRIYIVERNDHLIVLRYAIGAESERPADVDEGILDEIVRSLGLP